MMMFSRNRAVFIPLDVRYILLTVSGVAFPIRKYLRIKHPIDFVLRKDFVEEYLFAFLLFFRLSTLKHTILVGPNKRDFAAFAEEFAPDVQADFVAELGVGIGKEVFIRDVVDEGVVIENPMPINFVKEGCLYIFVGEQQFDEIVVESPCVVSDGGGDEFA